MRWAVAIVFALEGVSHASEVNLALDGFGGVFRQGHGVNVTATSTPVRSFSDQTLAPYGATGFAGVGARVDIVYDDRWVLDLGSIRFATAFGPSSRTYAGLDGSVVSAEPSSMIYGSIGGGLGIRAKRRRFAFEALLEIGGSLMASKAVAWDGTGARDLSTDPSMSFMMHLDLEACRRIDPASRVCLVVRPHIYDFGWINGGSIALRWEIGP